jgi:hypothetical protein
VGSVYINYGFQSGELNPWVASIDEGNDAQVVPAPDSDGPDAYSLKVTIASSADSRVTVTQPDGPLCPNTKYTYSFDIYLETNSPNGEVKAFVAFPGRGTGGTVEFYPKQHPTGEWITVSGEFTVPADVYSGTLYFFSAGYGTDAGFTYYIDNALVIPATAASTQSI